MEKLRQKIIAFISSPKDVPLLAGVAMGVYLLLYYYSKNFSLANSWVQLFWFTAYYLLLPTGVLFIGYKIIGSFKSGKFQKQFLFFAIPVLFALFILQISFTPISPKKIFLGVVLLFGALSFRFSNYYKLFVVLLPLMALFNVLPLLKIGYVVITSTDEWCKQPDGIEQVKFKSLPNIYYIQPDGYASFKNLRDSNHKFDNSNFEGFLKKEGFTLYDGYRSNYFSTLLSNSSMFNMKHHYVADDVELYKARQLIAGSNAVLRTLKNNGYTTHFITEKPYLVMNRPRLGYDDCDFNYSELPIIKDGWEINKDVEQELKKRVAAAANIKSPDFYFIEKLSPGHISGIQLYTKGAAEEKRGYLLQVQAANNWLKKVISYITNNDPKAMIIIAADHGGFAGYDYTHQSEIHTKGDPLLIQSVFGAGMAIKWNNDNHGEYDKGLKTSVNLFRTVFAFLGEDKALLNNLQEDGSYIKMEQPAGLYKNIDSNGKVVFIKKQ